VEGRVLGVWGRGRWAREVKAGGESRRGLGELVRWGGGEVQRELFRLMVEFGVVGRLVLDSGEIGRTCVGGGGGGGGGGWKMRERDGV